MNEDMFCSLVERLDEGAKKMETRWDKMQETLEAILQKLSEPCLCCHRPRNSHNPHPTAADGNGSVGESGQTKLSRRSKQRQRQRQRLLEKEQLAASEEAKQAGEGSVGHATDPVQAADNDDESPSASERKRNFDDEDDGCDSVDPASKRMRSGGDPDADADCDGDEL